MSERYIEKVKADPKLEAADFLRQSLASHAATRQIIGVLETDSLFGKRFGEACTPLEVLESISEFGTQKASDMVARIVDKWVNTGNRRNPSPARQIIGTDLEAWSSERDRRNLSG